jgi:cytochrome c
MTRLVLLLPTLLLFSVPSFSQQQAPSSAPSKPSDYAAIPVEAARQSNPVKSTPESMARAKKWWVMDCEMCHGKNGNGKGDTAKEMKLAVKDFTDASTLKDRTDGELFYIIKNGHNDMPAEGPRVKTDEAWDLVNYVRSFTKKPDAEAKP